jgi:glycosyltransferase involved in cell wall biosynthesis
MSHSRIDKLILIEISDLQSEHGKYYGKNAVIKYANEMSGQFDSTYFFSTIIDGKSNYKTEFINERIKFVRENYNTHDNIINKIRNLVMDQIILLKKVSKRTAVIINSPNIWYLPVLPLIRLKCGYLISYMASDPRGCRYFLGKRSLKTNIYSSIFIFQGNLISMVCDRLFVCGNLDPYRKYGKKVERSKLMLNLEKPVDIDIKIDRIRYQIVILFVGQLDMNKGVDVLIKAFQESLQTNITKDREIVLQIVGDGPERHNLEQLVKDLGCSNKVSFTGYVDDSRKMARIYIDSSVLVVPTLFTEGSPRVIDEAMFYGVPVIASDMNYGDLYSNGQNIILVTPGDQSELTHRICEVVSNEELRNKLVRNGLQRMEEVMSESAANQHIRAIKSVEGV